MEIKILSVRINILTKGQALDKVAEFLSEAKEHVIFTPNPEMLVAAHKDSYLQGILNKSDLNLCDGKGVEQSVKICLSKEDKSKANYFKRIPGVDFIMDICWYAEKYGFSVYLLGSGDEMVIMKTVEKLKEKFPKLKIAGYHPGPKLESIPNKKLKYRSDDNDRVVTDIIQTEPDILFVGFGHSKQEKWIHENIEKLPGVKIAMGIGGSFDMISGKIPRAPIFLRKLGLEWLWRLMREPSRFGRVWTALITYPLLFISERGKKCD